MEKANLVTKANLSLSTPFHTRTRKYLGIVFSPYYAHIAYKCILANKRILLCWPKRLLLGAFRV